MILQKNGRQNMRRNVMLIEMALQDSIFRVRTSVLTIRKALGISHKLSLGRASKSRIRSVHRSDSDPGDMSVSDLTHQSLQLASEMLVLDLCFDL